MKKKLFSLGLALMMSIGMTEIAMADGIPFIDVAPHAWYYNSVELSYEMNLINGTTSTTFAPDQNLDGGSAIKLAAGMHQTHEEGEFNIVNGTPWYQNFVDYAVNERIIRDEDDYNWTANVTRGEFAEIFSEALPSNELKEISTVPDGSIKDLPSGHKNYDAIYTLYRAGVLTGAGEEQLANPDHAIMRSEVATILVRMMDKSERISFSMETPKGKLNITKQPVAVTVESGKDATFAVTVSDGTAPYEYQWQYKLGGTWINMIGEDKTILAVTNAVANSEHRCVITDDKGEKVESIGAMLTVTVSTTVLDTLVIAKEPTNYTITDAEQNFSFTVEVEGGKEPYTYKWEDYDGRQWNESGTNSATYSGNIKTIKNSEIPHFRCTITDANGTWVSTGVVQPVRPRIEITAQPENAVGDVGDTIPFSVTANGGVGQLSYQWQVYRQLGKAQAWGNMNGATSSSYSGSISDSEEYKEMW